MEELKWVVFSMHPNICPDLDRFVHEFYQKNWVTIKEDLLNFMNICLKTQMRLKKILNRAMITVIPKTKQLTKISNFRPLSLCNVSYIIFWKLLARLKKCINSFISPYHNAFKKHRHISDNSILVTKILNSMRKKKELQNCMVIKINLHKVFDQLEYDLLILF